MKHYFFILFTLILLPGCVAKHIEPDSTLPTSNISFERDAKSPFLGSVTVFVALDDSFYCNPAKGFMGQKKMATIDKGNPLVKTDNDGSIRISSKDNYRILVRNAAGFTICDVVLGFRSEINKSYKLKASSDLKSEKISCSAKLLEVHNGKEKEVKLNEYNACHNDY